MQADRDPLAQLEKLKALHDAGAIDDTEFAKMKADLLSAAG
ncbi:SHOCT domain-containing protein [Sulfitobacter pseudonitzschiae]|uniref:SHOCT domain-containing protein n=1 Tax=Pseudosulfitobacter pseudonitzschiae TaxID=1402135 RepID=A0A9Q2NSL9_9RHOB|nr:SHOCT domain-containing protein [Pseudosulfitobacter pseudonitzschiae]MBM2400327.1 SHOCT domain-containing protein [Pseudosulfitobacter pseudonitzschiae]